MTFEQIPAGPKVFRKRTMRLETLVSDLRGLRPIAPNVFRAYGRKTIDPAFRERIMVAVAEVNKCRYCSYTHHEWAVLAGVDAGTLPADGGQADPGLDARGEIAIAWAQMKAQADLGPVPEPLESQFRAAFTASECHDIEVTVRAMRLMNLSGNTVDALMARRRGMRAPGGRLADELAVAAVLIPTLGLGVLIGAIVKRRSPIAVWTSFQAFSSEMEDRLAEPVPARAANVPRVPVSA